MLLREVIHDAATDDDIDSPPLCSLKDVLFNRSGAGAPFPDI